MGSSRRGEAQASKSGWRWAPSSLLVFAPVLADRCVPVPLYMISPLPQRLSGVGTVFVTLGWGAGANLIGLAQAVCLALVLSLWW